MTSLFKGYDPIWPLPILSSWLLITMSACRPDGDYSSFQSRSRNPEKLVIQSFIGYMHTISDADFPPAAFPPDSPKYQESTYSKQIQTDPDLQFFPAIFWQLYALDGKAKWKHLAEKHSRILYHDDVAEAMVQAEAMLYGQLAKYLVERDEADRTALLTTLSRYIAGNEADTTAPDCHSTTDNSSVKTDRLLANWVLFFASKETGDPIYAQLAQQHSEQIFTHYFQDEQSNELYYALANCKTPPDIRQWNELKSSDLYRLAVIFYGFTILNDQQENERYHSLCIKLAELFSSMAGHADPVHQPSAGQEGLLTGKMDILSKTLVCIALNKLRDRSGDHYGETTEKLFEQILDELNHSDEKGRQYSSRLYYYLFEFFTENNSL